MLFSLVQRPLNRPIFINADNRIVAEYAVNPVVSAAACERRDDIPPDGSGEPTKGCWLGDTAAGHAHSIAEV